MRKLLFILSVVLLPFSAFATDYYVTQSGTGTGTSSSSPWSVSTYNASTKPTGGDTVYFLGTITSTVAPNTGGTGNGTGRLILDFSGATLNTANPRINCNGKNYVTFSGGGSWSQGQPGGDSVYTAGCTFGPLSGGQNCFTFNNSQSHDVTIQGFQSTLSASNAYCAFIFGKDCYNLLVTNNNIINMSNMYYTDSLNNHDVTFSNNYFNSSNELVHQNDIISVGDVYNMIIEGNKFIQHAVGNTVTRHNDIIQNYRSGSSSSGSPYNWTIRYNWLELDVVGGTGDTSQLMLEAMANNGGFALKLYGNVLRGTAADSGSNNGANVGGSGTYYCYNNTIIREYGPNNVLTFSSPGTLYAKNNVGWAPSSGWDGINWTMTNAGWSHNFFYNWETPSSLLTGLLGLLNANPLFVDTARAIYSTQSSSPLRGAGDNTIGSEYAQGIAVGATWPNPTLVSRGSSWDAGAFQSSGSSSSQAPSNAKISVTIP